MVRILSPRQIEENPVQQIESFERDGDKPLIVLDTDGCIVDNMNVKQILIFHPQIMTYWNLWGIESYVREVAEFVNLYSKTRGINRFPTNLEIFNCINNRSDMEEEKLEKGIQPVNIETLEDYLRTYKGSGRYSLTTIEEYAIAHRDDPEAGIIYEWCVAVNDQFRGISQKIKPFKGVPDLLEQIAEIATTVVVSTTPYRDLVDYWTRYGIDKYVEIICGQEQGGKERVIRELMQRGEYTPEEVIMVGDAFGDHDAVKANKGSFFPIIPGKETISWEKFPEALDAFMRKQYGDMEPGLIGEFKTLLMQTAPWEKVDYDHKASYMQRQSLRIQVRDEYRPAARLKVME